MKKKRLLFCIVIFFTTSLLQAQNGSFMGKRIIFNMGASFSPAWRNPNFMDNSEHHYKWYSFNYTLSPNIEIIAWKLGTVGVGYHFFKTKYEYEYFVADEDPFNESFLWGNWKTQLDDLTSHGFAVYYKQYFTSRARAPMGAFVKFQLDGFFFKYPDNPESQTMDTGNLFAFKFEFGRDFLFFNRLRFSTGLSLGVPFGGYKGLFNVFNTESIEESAKTRILGHYWLGFTVNIGILAF
jgi:hypothetical protein